MRKALTLLAIGLSSVWMACDRDSTGSGGSGVSTETPSTLADSASTRRDEQRKLIRTADIELLVSNLEVTRGKLDDLIVESGGFASKSRTRNNRRRVCSVVLRVPEGTLGATLKSIKTLGKVVAESLATEDATNEFVDTKARIRNLVRTEERLLDILQKVAGNLAEILPVESELTRVRGEIEQLTARSNQIEELVALATVTVTLTEESQDVIEEPDDIWRPLRSLKRNAGAIFMKSCGVLVVLVAGAANFVIALIPWLALLALVLVARPRWRTRLKGLFSPSSGTKSAPHSDLPAGGQERHEDVDDRGP